MYFKESQTSIDDTENAGQEIKPNFAQKPKEDEPVTIFSTLQSLDHTICDELPSDLSLSDFYELEDALEDDFDGHDCGEIRSTPKPFEAEDFDGVEISKKKIRRAFEDKGFAYYILFAKKISGIRCHPLIFV